MSDEEKRELEAGSGEEQEEERASREPGEMEEPSGESERLDAVEEPEASEHSVVADDAGASEPQPATEDVCDSVRVDLDPEAEMSRMTRRSAVTGVVAIGAAYGGWKWLTSRQPLPDDRLQWPLRRTLESNERIAKAYFSRQRRVKEWPLSKRDPNPRMNGRLGLSADADHSGWRLRIEGLAAGGVAELTLGDLRKLPKVEMVTELRCIEGWSEFVHWGGVRFFDLMKALPPATRDGGVPDLDENPQRLVRYVAMETPGRGYWVGLDMASALHPQTLLAYEINDAPLDWGHGAPLRLVIPVKYGIKNIKRIGLIRYTDVRPADYWAERKYDWYAGL